MDRLIKPALYVLCSLVLHFAPASAGPREVSQYLIRTPVSMMTYGVIELSRLLDEDKKKIGLDDEAGLNNILVNYDYDADLIAITAYCMSHCGREATEEGCGKLVNQIRFFASVKVDGKPIDPQGSFFSSFFTQLGYVRGDEPKELRQQIYKMFVISVLIQQPPSPGPDSKLATKEIKCEAPLLGTGYSVKHP